MNQQNQPWTQQNRQPWNPSTAQQTAAQPLSDEELAFDLLYQEKSLMANITSDVLFPPKIGRSVASSIKDCTYAELSSLFGHDGFLVESKALNAILAPFFESSLG